MQGFWIVLISPRYGPFIKELLKIGIRDTQISVTISHFTFFFVIHLIKHFEGLYDGQSVQETQTSNMTQITYSGNYFGVE